ncbi:hypothetical protein [Eubacterium oxidoreducens]|uniref:Uncharacterized protein n=1 Tax=Eubacterium oxidoreducens TaxID=1732 RepID=A0A1G6B3S1_EUBOX|nr:hypothetical protein [Eubacterium oxidoreducens]SDB15318.1 hypothetical protein SAMN02910417_01138 [Eubacterium oxidoreducens]
MNLRPIDNYAFCVQRDIEQIKKYLLVCLIVGITLSGILGIVSPPLVLVGVLLTALSEFSLTKTLNKKKEEVSDYRKSTIKLTKERFEVVQSAPNLTYETLSLPVSSIKKLVIGSDYSSFYVYMTEGEYVEINGILQESNIFLVDTRAYDKKDILTLFQELMIYTDDVEGNMSNLKGKSVGKLIKNASIYSVGLIIFTIAIGVYKYIGGF